MKLSDAPVRRPVTRCAGASRSTRRARGGVPISSSPRSRWRCGSGVRVRNRRRSRSRCARPATTSSSRPGLCLTEGLLDGRRRSRRDRVLPRRRSASSCYNVVTVRLRTRVPDDVRERRFLANSSCGICGKAALDEIEVRCAPVGDGPDRRGERDRTLPRPARATPARLRADRRAARGRPVRARRQLLDAAKTSGGTTRSTS